LVVAGAAGQASGRRLRQVVQRLGLVDHVVFAGFQPGEKLVQLYNGAQMLMHPSLHEGFSFTILEALACGTPVVAAATTSIPEAAGPAALYYDPPDDFESLADRTESVLQDRQLATQLSSHALQRAREFSWDRCVRQTLQLYDRLN
jgi:glycosyltransferase involved in cell wall biosynthesis